MAFAIRNRLYFPEFLFPSIVSIYLLKVYVFTLTSKVFGKSRLLWNRTLASCNRGQVIGFGSPAGVRHNR